MITPEQAQTLRILMDAYAIREWMEGRHITLENMENTKIAWKQLNDFIDSLTENDCCHRFIMDDEHVKHSCCQNCGVVKENTK